MRLLRGLVWITGASSGIGRCSALLLAKNHWRVAVSARNEEALNDLAKKHPSIHAYPLDVADPVTRKEVYRIIRQDLGPVDILVNNAGYGIRGAMEEMELWELKNLFDVNVFAPAALTKLVVPEMRQRRSGRIIMVSSVVGRVALPLSGAYSASKFALEGYSDALRTELMPWGIKVILVEPGPIATEFGQAVKSASISRMKRSDSPYYPYYKRLLNGGRFRHRVHWGPKTVADAIRDACENPKPCTRYPVHPLAVLMPWLQKLLPTSLMDRLIGVGTGLNRPAAMP